MWTHGRSMKDFFISYNKADRGWAEWIAWQLESAEYTTIIQIWDFGAGSNFVLEMHRALVEAPAHDCCHISELPQIRVLRSRVGGRLRSGSDGQEEKIAARSGQRV